MSQAVNNQSRPSILSTPQNLIVFFAFYFLINLSDVPAYHMANDPAINIVSTIAPNTSGPNKEFCVIKKQIIL
jgi:hypothetical protein